jgi:hypothetical protein
MKDFESNLYEYLVNLDSENRYWRAIEFGFFQEKGGNTFKNLNINESGSKFTFNKRTYGNDKVYSLILRIEKYYRKIRIISKYRRRHKR